MRFLEIAKGFLFKIMVQQQDTCAVSEHVIKKNGNEKFIFV